MHDHAAAPALPPGRHVELPGRGRTWIREAVGPPGAPTLLLLHGWTASADLNWFPSYQPLSRRYHVVAIDHRGHGRGIRSRRPFSLASCADDAAALIRALRLGQVIAVGYSMGGPVAQLLWRRHPELVSGLVLCATSRTFASRAQEKLQFAGLAGLALGARAVPAPVKRVAATRVLGGRSANPSLEGWLTHELQRSDWGSVLEAGAALGRFDSRAWIGDVDVPTAVVLTVRDGLVAPKRQLALARAVPGATVHPVQGDHTVCVTAPGRFIPGLLDACGSVARRLAVRA